MKTSNQKKIENIKIGLTMRVQDIRFDYILIVTLLSY